MTGSPQKSMERRTWNRVTERSPGEEGYYGSRPAHHCGDHAGQLAPHFAELVSEGPPGALMTLEEPTMGVSPKGQESALKEIRAGVRWTDRALKEARTQPKEEGPAIESRGSDRGGPRHRAWHFKRLRWARGRQVSKDGQQGGSWGRVGGHAAESPEEVRWIIRHALWQLGHCPGA